MKMNKKGDIPTMILFVIALILIVSTLFLFYTSQRNFDNNSKKWDLIMNEISFDEKYSTAMVQEMARETIAAHQPSGDIKEEFEKIAQTHDLKEGFQGNLFAKIRTGDFDITINGDSLILNIKGVSVLADDSSNRVNRNFDINSVLKINAKSA